jgi:restriction endonuclease S subunit
MARGKKNFYINKLDEIFWSNLPFYIKIINKEFIKLEGELVQVGKCIDKLGFTVPKGLISKQIMKSGEFPVISQSQEYSVGYTDNSNLLISKNLPLIIFGDHSKTIKIVDKPFVIGADGVKLLKPIKDFDINYFYYSLFGVITDTKDYGRHYSLLRQGNVLKTTLQNQVLIVRFLTDLRNNKLDIKTYFNIDIEAKIIKIQNETIKSFELLAELTYQQFNIKKLKQAYLSEAIRGELILQDPNDEPASELLARIKEEKQAKVDAGELKKQKPLKAITKEEIPFEIPDSWVWCRLGEVCEMNPRNKADDLVDAGFIPMPLINARYGTIAQYESRKWGMIKAGFTHFANDDVVVAKITPCFQNSKSAIIKNLPNGIGAGTTELYVLRGSLNLLSQYIYLFIKTQYFLIEGERLMRGVAGQKRVTPEYIRDKPFPLPPIEEQKRIVAKLNDLMSICDTFEGQNIKARQDTKELLQVVLKEMLEG